MSEVTTTSQEVQPDPAVPRLLLNIREAAASLGISERTLWAMTNPRGPIPSVRIGTRVLYDPRDLQTWIDGQKEGAP